MIASCIQVKHTASYFLFHALLSSKFTDYIKMHSFLKQHHTEELGPRSIFGSQCRHFVRRGCGSSLLE